MYKLNGLDCGGWQVKGADAVEFSMACAYAEVSGLKGAGSLKVTDEDGTELADFSGYELVSQWEVEGAVRARFLRKLEANTEAAIRSLEANMATVSKKVDDGMAEASTRADEAAVVAGEAKQAAERAQQSASPSVRAASALYVNATAITNSQLGDVRDLIEDFVPGAEYKKGLIRRYEGAYYRMAKDIDSNTSKTYQPGEGTESLYTLIDLAPDGIRIWHMPTDATNSFANGEKAHYPDADGAIYVSKRDGNTSEPGTDKWWVLDGTEG